MGVMDTATRELVFTVATGVKKAAIQQKRVPWNEGIIGTVISKGKPLPIADAQKDPHFFRRMDKETGFTTHSVLCVPMKIRGHIIGAVEVLNRGSFLRRHGKPWRRRHGPARHDS